jgi:hypothetical protein
MKFALLSNDYDKNAREKYLFGKPWTFINMLPYEINIYAIVDQKLDLIANIAAFQRKNITETKTKIPLQEGMTIHVTRPGNYHNPTSVTTPQYQIARSVNLFSDSRVVKIGDIVYEDQVSVTNTKDIHHDIIGIRFHNHLTMPIDIYHKGNRIGSVAADDGTNFMAGSPNSVYLNNERHGFEIGDQIGFIFSHDQKKYATITLIDNYTSDIIIGMTTQHFVAPLQDAYSYRVDTPNITGLKRFDQVTGYLSKNVETNDPTIRVLSRKQYKTVLAAADGVKL